ncbi:MAG TPA: tetratricopeptide repeat protein [Thermoanaerobaculia bacterium]|nr:tetratricopeptide repeat protein [Thermoanaerobaculia bacterium]
MRKATLLSLICLFVALPLCAATAAEYAAQGRAALTRDDHEKAVELYTKAIALEPKNADYHYYLGAAYGEMAQQANVLKQASLAKKTREAFEKAVALNPKHTDARLGLVSYYLLAPGFMGGGDDKALAQAAAIKAYDSIDGHRAYATIYRHQKKPDLARKELVEAVRENPKSAKAHTILGNSYANEKNWSAALHEYEMAVQLDPAFMIAYLRIGQHAANSGTNYARGEEALRKYLADPKEQGHAAAWMALGVIQEKQGKKAEAKTSYTNALKLVPHDKGVKEALKRVS